MDRLFQDENGKQPKSKWSTIFINAVIELQLLANDTNRKLYHLICPMWLQGEGGLVKKSWDSEGVITLFAKTIKSLFFWRSRKKNGFYSHMNPLSVWRRLSLSIPFTQMKWNMKTRCSSSLITKVLLQVRKHKKISWNETLMVRLVLFLNLNSRAIRVKNNPGNVKAASIADAFLIALFWFSCKRRISKRLKLIYCVTINHLLKLSQEN